MPVSPAREIAYQILRRVEAGRAFAVDLLQQPQVSELRAVDRNLVTELVMGALRWRGELDFQIEQLSGKPLKYFDPEIATILRLGVYQIRFLEKIPKSAVVNEAVELAKSARKRSAAGLVNAVLRKCEPPARRRAAMEKQKPDPGVLESLRRSYPAWLLERWEHNFGPKAAGALAWASNSVPRTTLRVCRGEREEVQRQLASEGIQTEPGKYACRAQVVQSGNVQASRAVREGPVVIQDEASQLVTALVAPERNQRVLDLCAAPGIKTCQLAEALGHGTLVACDLSAPRLRTMARLVRERIPTGVRLHVVRLDARSSLPFGCLFDRILLDVPCSGTGTLARNPEIKWRLQPSDLLRLAAGQEEMLANALAVLAPGGRLVYSTCSLEPEENEQVVERVLQDSEEVCLLSAAELSSEFPALAPLFDAHSYFRTRPDLHSMDGFFAAVIVRTAKPTVERKGAI
jgi:16S rRNA (cytosine967-C5)-methyltransferase